MSILEQIKLEGQQKGIERNQIEMVRNLHWEGFEIEIIVPVTGLNTAD